MTHIPFSNLHKVSVCGCGCVCFFMLYLWRFGGLCPFINSPGTLITPPPVSLGGSLGVVPHLLLQLD